jgi:sugar lactone lactonase YvrE
MLKAVLQSKIKPNLSVSCARGHWSVAIALFVAALAALLDPAAAHAQSGSSYTWTNFVGTPGVPGGSDGTGSSALFSSPAGITVDGSGNLYVASSSDTVRRVTPAGVVTTIAGIFNVPGNTNGTGSNARFNQPFGIALDGSGNAYVVDSGNNEIRYMTQAGVVSTLAGGFSSPNGAASDSAGNLYVADSNNSTIRKVTPAGVVTTVAGVAGITGTADGMGSAARFYHPYGIAVDGSNNLFVADTANKTIREITPAGLVSTIAGTPLVAGSNDGLAATAHFSDPYGIAVDSNGDIFVADTLNFTVREISSLGNVTTIGGLPGVSGTQGGIGSAARFLQVMGLVVGPGGALYVCDNANARISVGVPSNFATGSVAVNIVPSGAVTAGAQWQLDGGSLQPSGATISTGTGSHTITYSAAAGYTAPASQPVAVSAGQTTAVTGTYNAILPATLTVIPSASSQRAAGIHPRIK